jgi:hypothetical protein
LLRELERILDLDAEIPKMCCSTFQVLWRAERYVALVIEAPSIPRIRV